MNYELVRITKMDSEETLKEIVKRLNGQKIELVIDKGFEIYLIVSH